MATLAWFVLGDRHHQRRAHITFDKIERAVRNLILIHAAQVMGPRKAKPRRLRGAQAPMRISLRAVGGSWLRRHLRTRGDLFARATRLLNALRNWRDLGAALARRRAAGLTRLAPAWRAADRAQLPCASAPATPCAADTS